VCDAQPVLGQKHPAAARRPPAAAGPARLAAAWREHGSGYCRRSRSLRIMPRDHAGSNRSLHCRRKDRAVMTLALLVEQLFNGVQFGLMLFLMPVGVTLVFPIMRVITLPHLPLFI